MIKHTLEPMVAPTMELSAETLAYWYFRLNGFLTVQNFILHPDEGSSQRTEADLYGVRFPYRKELDMQDESQFTCLTTKPLFVIVEVKLERCSLNKTWTDPSKRNIHYALAAMGALKQSLIDSVANELYRNHVYEDVKAKFQLITVGLQTNRTLARDRPGLNQLTFSDMLQFIYKRFSSFKEQKKRHVQWDSVGQLLWNMSATDELRFVECGIAKVKAYARRPKPSDQQSRISSNFND